MEKLIIDCSSIDSIYMSKRYYGSGLDTCTDCYFGCDGAEEDVIPRMKWLIAYLDAWEEL